MNHSHSPPAAAEPQPAAEADRQFAAFVGIDWADEEHAVCVLDSVPDREKERLRREVLPHTPEAIAAWAGGLARDFGDRPVAVMVEQSRGALLQALMQYPQLVLFPINPKQAARYREALVHSGRKDDPTDAECLARFVREHHRELRVWKPADTLTRQLAQLVELRRKAVDSRKQTTQQAEARLKQYFPLALELGDTALIVAVLERWPTHQTLARANPATLRKFFAQHGRRNADQVNELIARIRTAQPLTTDRAMIDPHALAVKFLVKELRLHEAAVAEFDAAIAQCFAAHPDAELFRSPPGAGAALAPRLLVAFGPDRGRFASADEVQAYSGIAPITKRSGKSCHVTKRYFCNKFLRQTFHEFADHARKWSTWSKAFYEHLRARGHRHHAAVRSLAFKWIRILFRCWKNRQLYDEARYLRELRAKGASYLPNLQST
ncbi:MAG TPA: IS110 family transposase [Terrimicrobiaceae bacterium]|nr:IS110 family transposase [Terrimicrobiaceae bacterium]